MKALLWAAAAIVLVACGEEELPTKNAVEATVIEEHDTGSGLRTRYQILVHAPQAMSFEQRAQTVLAAAKRYSDEKQADLVAAFLVDDPQIGQNSPILAQASYSHDKGGASGSDPLKNGTWEASASDVVITEQQRMIARLWWQNRERYQKDDGFGGTETDEEAMKVFIAKKLHISEPEVSMIYVELIEYKK